MANEGEPMIGRTPETNDRMIAAAPEMYRALREIVRLFSDRAETDKEAMRAMLAARVVLNKIDQQDSTSVNEHPVPEGPQR